ncbi:MAG: thermonuclease family protein [Magnetospirillum sp. WYHS-4]
MWVDWTARIAVVLAGIAGGPAPDGDLLAAASGLRGPVPGPVEARVVRVMDGDTLLVRARPWVGVEVETRVRILGIDAPELHGACEEERRLAAKAKDLLEASVAGGPVFLHEVRDDKYGGRVLARVATAAGTDCAQTLIGAGLARPYGGRKRQPWCPPP